MAGWWKRQLRVNLTEKSWKTEEIAEKDLKALLGGSALGAKILLEEVPPRTDPLAPENKLIFAVGPLQGVNVPGNAKWSVITRGPLTGSFLDSAGTGHWAPAFKKTGYDLLVIEGRAADPTWLFIDDDGVRFLDGAALWGLDTVETGEKIKEILGDRRINALNIGPAGERGNPIACISCDGHSFAGRGGSGAVMGSKNLKAVAAWGTKEVPVADGQKAAALSKELFQLLHKQGEGFRQHGTPVVMVPLQEMGDVPIKYWRGDVWDRGAALLGAPRYTDYLNVKPLPCANCPIGCHRHIHFEYPDGRVLEGNGPEYETIGMMGANLLVDDLGAVCRANDRANRQGIDTVSCGAYIGFLMECFEAGWITTADNDGKAIRWGDGEALVDLTDKIARLEGIGRLFEKGILGAAAAIGHDSEKITVQVKNLDFPAHDPRAVFGLGVNYATGTRGACHERGDCQAGATGLMYPELGQQSPPDRFSVEEAAYSAYIYQTTSVLYNSLTLCKFMIKGAGMTLSDVSALMKEITGEEHPPKEMFRCAERGFALQRIINVRDGMSRKDDTLPPKMGLAAIVGGRAGKTPTPHDRILDDYYRLRGWDDEGIPKAETLEELGLGEYVAYLPGK